MMKGNTKDTDSLFRTFLKRKLLIPKKNFDIRHVHKETFLFQDIHFPSAKKKHIKMLEFCISTGSNFIQRHVFHNSNKQL